MGSSLQSGVQGCAQCRKLPGVHPPLQSLKKLAFFFSDMLRESFDENLQALWFKAASFGAGKELSQRVMFGQQFLHQAYESRELGGGREQFLLFCRKMKYDLLLELLLYLRLPGFEIDLTRLQRPIQTHTHSQRMLVLTGKRYEILVPEHTAIMRPSCLRQEEFVLG